MSTKRVVALVVGCLMILPAIGMLFGGGALAIGYGTQRNADGYFDVGLDQMQTPTVAVTGEDVKFATDPGSPDWLIDAIDLDVQLQARALEPDREIFVGIARQADLDRYLADVARDQVIRINTGAPVYRRQGSEVERVAAPAEQDFWVASTSGSGTQELTWSATSGRWAAVVMNADGTPGVSVTMTVGAKSGLILPLAVVLSIVGAIFAAVAVVLIVFGAAGARNDRRPGPGTHLVEPPAGPVQPGSSFPPPDVTKAEPAAHFHEVT